MKQYKPYNLDWNKQINTGGMLVKLRAAVVQSIEKGWRGIDKVTRRNK